MEIVWLILAIVLLPVFIKALPTLLFIYFVCAYLYLFWQFPLGKVIIVVTLIIWIIAKWPKKSKS